MNIIHGVAVDSLELHFVPPFDWPRMLGFLAGHATAGVEAVHGDTYLRSLEWKGDSGLLSVRPDPARNCLIAQLQGEVSRHLNELQPRLARMFDTGTDILQLHRDLDHDPWLGRLLANTPGLRIPGAWSGFEVVVRTIVGQQVSVKAATTVVGRLVQRAGRALPAPTHPLATWQFPTPAALAVVDLEKIGMPGKRAAALQNFARVVASGELPIDSLSVDSTALRQTLLALPGIGPWTVEYTAMRAWSDPDAWPGSDLVLMQAIAHEHPDLLKPGQQRLRSEQWRPWRAYAAMHLWNEIADRAKALRGG